MEVMEEIVILSDYFLSYGLCTLYSDIPETQLTSALVTVLLPFNVR